MEYKVNDIAITKKEHPCETRCNRWQIIRVGADIKIKCVSCGRMIMIPRSKFVKSAKKIIKSAKCE